MGCVTDKENMFGQIEVFMKANGKRIKPMEEEN
jgi:DNA polymerase III alpha subunit